jgi:hypothetical protein
MARGIATVGALLGVDEEPLYPPPVNGEGPSREVGRGGGGEPGFGLDINEEREKEGGFSPF